MSMLLHYYYGDRNEAAYIAIGTIIRAAGHGFNIDLISIEYENEDIIDFLSENFENVNVTKIDGKTEHRNKIRELMISRLKNIANSSNSKKTLFVIINFDLLHKILIEEQFRDLMRLFEDKLKYCEIILTGETEIPIVIEKADYVSEVNKFKSENFNVDSKMTNTRSK